MLWRHHSGNQEAPLIHFKRKNPFKTHPSPERREAFSNVKKTKNKKKTPEHLRAIEIQSGDDSCNQKHTK